MRRKSVRVLLLLTIIFLSFNKVSAQSLSTGGIEKLTGAVDSFVNKAAIEKLYMQFDKPAYTPGDTIWFKAYLLNAADLTPSLKSGILYAELANDSNKVVQRLMLPVAHGLSWGNITLDPKTFREGGYTLRAYTNWMRNFSEASIFKQHFYFADPNTKSWLVKRRVDLTKNGEAEKARLRLQFNQLNDQPVILKDLKLSVQQMGKNLFTNKVKTRLDGTVDVDFTLKNSVKKFTIVAQETGVADSSHRILIPIDINRPENIDLQFMPESGALIAGIPTHIGFKAINEDGKGVYVEGTIYDSKQQAVAKFRSAHKGIGAFDMEPVPGEVYSARIDSPRGASIEYKFPIVRSAGTTLKVNAIAGADSLALIIAGVNAKGSYYLVGQTNEGVCYSAIINLPAEGIRFKIPTSAFPTGITKLTLLNSNLQSLNERLVFINHHDFLKFSIQQDKAAYLPGDSIALQLKVADKAGHPLAGNFSVSVTDDSQVKIDTAGSQSIFSNFLLTSDLKGNIEEPGYYFLADAGGTIEQHLDNLMLTQGWVNYDWKNVFGEAFKPSFAADTDFVIKGRVSNVFNKPVANSQVLLFSKKPELLIERVTNKDGRFEIRDVVPIDTPAYIMQARNKRGKSFNVNLSVDEFKPPVFAMANETIVPWYVNSSNRMLDFAKGAIAFKAARDTFKGSGHLLKEVKITAKKFVKDSQNPNGSGNADVVIDEKELEKAGRKTFLDLLIERVPGFHEDFFLLIGGPFSKKVKVNRILYHYITEGVEPEANMNWYFVKDEAVKIIVDGVSLFKIYSVDGISAFRDIKGYLTSHYAEDVTGIEVSHSAKYAMKYIPMEYGMSISPADIAYVEITTRAGSGPVMPFTPGTYLYKPMAFSLPRQFYQPKYSSKNKGAAIGDYGPTIYWQPNVISDNTGNTVIKFQAPYKAGTYMLVLEGTDLNGNLGSYTREIKVSGQ